MLLYVVLAVLTFFVIFNISEHCQKTNPRGLCAKNMQVAVWFAGVALCVLAVAGTYLLIAGRRGGYE